MILATIYLQFATLTRLFNSQSEMMDYINDLKAQGQKVVNYEYMFDKRIL